LKILFFTGSRSEYGIIRPLLLAIDSNPNFEYKLIVSGSHFLQDLGQSINEIEKDKLKGPLIKTPIFESNHSPGINEFNKTSQEIYNICQKENPQFLFITGDRIESYACALGAHFAKTDIIHYGGGNISKGSWDDAYRYNISNLSKYNLVTNKVAAENLFKSPAVSKKNNIYNVGSFSVDALLKYLKTEDCSPYKNPFALMTFHPSTKADEDLPNIMNQIIDELLNKKIHVIITYPNTDSGYQDIIKTIEYRSNEQYVTVIKNLGSQNFYRHLRYADLIIGNSSSSFVEAPYFGTPILNIGKRQEGRISDRIIDSCDLNMKPIRNWIEQQISLNFKKNTNESLFGEGDAVDKALYLLNKLGNE